MTDPDAPESLLELRIDALGAQGDGIGRADGKAVFVEGALPGEKALVRAGADPGRARLVSVLEPSPDRRAPPCRHAGACGGCALQHLSGEAASRFKQELIEQALAKEGVSAPPVSFLTGAPGARRRAVFAVAGRRGERRIGFHARRSHSVLPISECPVLDPRLSARIEDISELAGLVLEGRSGLQAQALATPSGIDLNLAGADPRTPADARARLASRAMEMGFARVSLNGETAALQREPTIRAGAAWITPPPGGFLQATEAAQEAMTRFVLEVCSGAKRTVDLFAGAGTFSLPLASHGTVHAVETDAAALRALNEAARRTPGLKPVTTERRCLFSNPLGATELNRYDALVIDPPRAGAEAQCRMIVRSAASVACMVSCNPQSFARDIRILTEGGFEIASIRGIDQFYWSTHVEVMAELRRPGRKAGRG